MLNRMHGDRCVSIHVRCAGKMAKNALACRIPARAGLYVVSNGKPSSGNSQNHKLSDGPKTELCAFKFVRSKTKFIEIYIMLGEHKHIQIDEQYLACVPLCGVACGVARGVACGVALRVLCGVACGVVCAVPNANRFYRGCPARENVVRARRYVCPCVWHEYMSCEYTTCETECTQILPNPNPNPNPI